MAYGTGSDCVFFDVETPLEGVDTATSHALNAIKVNDRAGLQLIIDPYEVDVVVDVTDNVVASTKRMTLANFTFTGLTGAVVHITGGDNEGAHTVTSVVSAHVAVFSGSTFTNETFDPDEVEIYVTYPLLEGSWKIEISNDHTPTSTGPSYDQDADVEGHWTNITSYFGSPAIAAVDATVAASYSQYVQADISVRAMQFTFTSTAGFGYPLVLGQLRSMS